MFPVDFAEYGEFYHKNLDARRWRIEGFEIRSFAYKY
jgi:hypothetical protein